MQRTDLYTTIHKAIRAVLFDTSTRVARTAFADPAESAFAVARVRRLLGFLDEHAEHEDAVLMPEIAALAPEVHAALQADHTRVSGMQHEIAALCERFAGANADERHALGQRLQQRLHRLIAAQLAHLEREEVDANRVLQAHRSDAELQALNGRIVASIAPVRLAEWMELLLPELSASERGELLRGMRQNMPPAAFDAVTGPARRTLGGIIDAALAPALA